MAEMYSKGLYIPYRSEAIALAKTPPTAKGFAEFANVPQKITLLPTPTAILAVEGLSDSDTFIRYFEGGFGNQTSAQVFRDLDKRLNDAVKAQLTPAELEAYRAGKDREVLAQ
jgi:hypothetical protein